MTDDEKYRGIVQILLTDHAYFVSVATENYYKEVRHRVWLQLLGLMETWDLIIYD